MKAIQKIEVFYDIENEVDGNNQRFSNLDLSNDVWKSISQYYPC